MQQMLQSIIDNVTEVESYFKYVSLNGLMP